MAASPAGSCAHPLAVAHRHTAALPGAWKAFDPRGLEQGAAAGAPQVGGAEKRV